MRIPVGDKNSEGAALRAELQLLAALRDEFPRFFQRSALQFEVPRLEFELLLRVAQQSQVSLTKAFGRRRLAGMQELRRPSRGKRGVARLGRV